MPERELSGFDPRFNPAFQPGYDPATDPVATPTWSREAPPAGRVVVVPDAPTREASGPPARESSGDASRETSREPTREHSSGRADDAAPQPADSALTPARASGLNPFLLTLWALAAILVASGLSILAWLPDAERALQSGADGSRYFLVQAASGSAPIVIALGVAVSAALLFWHAREWERRATPR